MRKTIEELREEQRKLLAKEEIARREEIKRQERRTLERNVRRLKHPRVVKVIKVARRSVEGVGMLAGMAGRKVAPIAKRGLMNLAENAREQSREQPRRVRKITKKKSPKKKKKVVVKKVRRRRAPTSNVPSYGDFFG